MEKLVIKGMNVPVYKTGTVVVGTGVAGFNCADTLATLGKTDIMIISEGIKLGTSRNTGSDKQTYYKISTNASDLDSIDTMCETLVSGVGVHGDNAFVEAAYSLKSFFKLVTLGVPFPSTEYGEYVGYKTDHDPKKRATSAGPLTSKYMTEKLENQVNLKGIEVRDKTSLVRILVDNGAVCGAIVVDGNEENTFGLGVILCEELVLCTGGPAGIYSNTVYPYGHTGGNGAALEAGAKMTNAHSWQYGIASLKFRWNLSGTYQQVLPRYVSVDPDGTEHEFLEDYISDKKLITEYVFLKGYQWPFDSRKACGSSLVDIIVDNEINVKGRRVFLDFMHEPSYLSNGGIQGVDGVAGEYLRNSNAIIETPIARLDKMNRKAIEIYAAHNIDLWKEMLEISVCAQHCNGGIAVDANWETAVKGLYCAGEAAGTFGEYRPGGTALNSAMCGSMRAAEHIAEYKKETKYSLDTIAKQVEEFTEKLFLGGTEKHMEMRKKYEQKMSAVAAHIRREEESSKLLAELEETIRSFFETVDMKDVRGSMKTYDLLVTAAAVLSAMGLSAKNQTVGGNITDGYAKKVLDGIAVPIESEGYNMVLETVFANGKASSCYVAPREVPVVDTWFENVYSNRG